MGFLFKRVWLLLCATTLLAPSPALAHAHLLRSQPADGARLSSAPTVIHLSFSERPELSMSFAELQDGHGTSYSLSSASRAGNDRLAIEFAILQSLPPGHYRLSWRTAASDGHPSSGKISFDVAGTADSSATSPTSARIDSPVVAATASAIQPATHAMEEDRAASFSNSLARALLFIGVLVLIGTVTFALVILPNAADVNHDSRETMLSRAALAGIAAAVLVACAAVVRLYLEATMMQAMPDMPGMSGMTAKDMVLGTTWGLAFMLQLGCSLIALVAFALAARKLAWAWYLAAACALVVAITPALGGHAAAAPNFTVAVVISDWLHVLAGGAWLGALLCVMVIGVPVACTCEGDERWACVSSLVRMFSRIAMVSVAALVISGTFASWVHLTSLSDLWTTAYGKTLLAKVALALLAMSVGAYNLARVQPHLAVERGTQALRKSAAVELAAGLLVLIVTGFLTGLSP
jgi:copper transport protein